MSGVLVGYSSDSSPSHAGWDGAVRPAAMQRGRHPISQACCDGRMSSHTHVTVISPRPVHRRKHVAASHPFLFKSGGGPASLTPSCGVASFTHGLRARGLSVAVCRLPSSGEWRMASPLQSRESLSSVARRPIVPGSDRGRLCEMTGGGDCTLTGAQHSSSPSPSCSCSCPGGPARPSSSHQPALLPARLELHPWMVVRRAIPAFACSSAGLRRRAPTTTLWSSFPRCVCTCVCLSLLCLHPRRQLPSAHVPPCHRPPISPTPPSPACHLAAAAAAKAAARAREALQTGARRCSPAVPSSLSLSAPAKLVCSRSSECACS